MQSLLFLLQAEVGTAVEVLVMIVAFGICVAGTAKAVVALSSYCTVAGTAKAVVALSSYCTVAAAAKAVVDDKSPAVAGTAKTVVALSSYCTVAVVAADYIEAVECIRNLAG